MSGAALALTSGRGRVRDATLALHFSAVNLRAVKHERSRSNPREEKRHAQADEDHNHDPHKDSETTMRRVVIVHHRPRHQSRGRREEEGRATQDCADRAALAP